MICDMQLFWDVFNVDSLPPNPDVLETFCVAYMDDAWRLMQRVRLCTFSHEQRRLALYAALFRPLCDRACVGQGAVKLLFQKSLMLKSSDGEKVRSLHWYAPIFSALFPLFLAIVDPKPPLADYFCDGGYVTVFTLDEISLSLRVKSGMILHVIGDLWFVLLLLSTLLYRSTDDATAATCYLEDRLDIFHEVKGLIKNMCLENIWKDKPLLNGTDILDMFYIVNGPLVGRMKIKGLQWQLAHPSGTAEDCGNWMGKQFPLFLKERSSS
ncbi:uncharacterized protein LOC131313383 [Rhododendron vialii]|uniref:uncharacterized protein LOC131313383 n=1 Tax=Rhododendron vialii TaxID=182163 RepID=UPI00265D8CAC|nr:uncharacterized protein LOC131313383 [Rhododendron vialii]